MIINFTIFAAHALDTPKIRDPFFLPTPQKKEHNKERYGDHNEQSVLRLVGIVQSGGKTGALIKDHKQVRIVYKDDSCDGYTVKNISQKDVVLVKGKKSKTLTLE